MKTVRHACVAFLLSAAVAVGFSVYTCRVIDKMKVFAEELPDAVPLSPPAVISEAEEYWEKNKLLLSLAVSHRELDDIEEALSAVISALENGGERAAYSTAISSLKERLARLLESERLSLEGVL